MRRTALLIIMAVLLVLAMIRQCRSPEPETRPFTPAQIDTVRPAVRPAPPALPAGRTSVATPQRVVLPTTPEPALYAATAARPLLAMVRIQPRLIDLTHVDSTGKVMVRTYAALDRIRYKEMRIAGDTVVVVERTRAGRALAWLWHKGKWVLVVLVAGTLGYVLAGQ